LLRGAEHFRRLRTEAPNLELAVTMPMTPSRLAEQLPATAGRPGGYLPTPAAFLRLAAAARSRLVVMTPFINNHGFEWLRLIFQAAGERVQKTVVLRDARQYAIELAVHHSDWLHTLGVSVADYSIAHSAESGRALPIETFHAKIVLADERLAYVGSANVLGSGDGTSLEAGVLIDAAALQLARLVDAVLRIARPF
jgi:phosphatidylserine/phosphatidylglycerophosphate/cardiolipin synthase-like enzyme